MKTCPKCKLGSPDEATRCDCGYDFTTARMETSYLPLSKDGIEVEKLPAAKFRARCWLGASFVVVIAHIICAVWQNEMGLAPLIDLLVIIVFIFCCTQYALCKGYKALYGLWGLLSVLGLVVLISKPYNLRHRA
jgi:hypothetical protein